MSKENLKFLKSFILKNVKPPEKGFVTKFWPREMKIAKDLYYDYPNDDFWKNVNIGFKVNSLAWFKMKNGDDLLKTKYKEFNFKPEIKENDILQLSDRKFGETLHNNKGNKFLKDFLN
jgi:hypothetical protein